MNLRSFWTVCASLFYMVGPSAESYQLNNNHSVCPFLWLLDSIYHVLYCRRAVWRQHQHVCECVCVRERERGAQCICLKRGLWWICFVNCIIHVSAVQDCTWTCLRMYTCIYCIFVCVQLICHLICTSAFFRGSSEQRVLYHKGICVILRVC